MDASKPSSQISGHDFLVFWLNLLPTYMPVELQARGVIWRSFCSPIQKLFRAPSSIALSKVSGTRDESVYRIYKIASATNRGRFASLEQKNEIENVVAGLQSINPNTVPVLGDPAPMDGALREGLGSL